MRLPIKADRIPIYIIIIFFSGCLVLGLCIIISLICSVVNASIIQWDSTVAKTLENTGILFLFSVAIQISITVLATLVIYEISSPFKILLVMPFAAGVVAPASSVYVFLSSALGPLNTSLLGTAKGLCFVIAFLDSWQWVGILLLACFFRLERIPPSHFEVARLDRMSRLRMWWLLVFPKIKGLILIYAIIRALDWFRKADLVRILAREGGPGYNLETFGMYIQRSYYFDANGEGFASLLLLIQVILLGLALSFAFKFRLTNWFDNEG